MILQRTHVENKQRILGDFLSNEETIAENNEILHSLWKKGKYIQGTTTMTTIKLRRCRYEW